MPNITIINDIDKFKLTDSWNPAEKFNSKGGLVDKNGNRASSSYKGPKYRIIEKRERPFSTFERIERGFLGTLAAVCTLCLALFSKSVRNLFTKSKESVRFAVLEKQIESNVDSKNVLAVLEKQPSFKVDSKKASNPQYKFLFKGEEISEDQDLNFALMETGGEQKLVPVISNAFGGGCRIYHEDSPLKVLLKIAQSKKPRYGCLGRHLGTTIGYLLKHPNNSLITEAEFLKFILEKDETGTPRICTLSSKSTLEVLDIIKEKKIPINLNDKTPDGETLFTLWAGKGVNITEAILELDPSVIEQTRERPKSIFVKAVLNGYKEEANLLLGAIEKRGIPLSLQELWIKRGFKNDCAFSEKEFMQLDQELKIKVFFAANAFGNEDIVKKLKLLGMETVPLFWPGPSILARNMDIITTRNAIEGFLKDLRKDSLLLTTEEFNRLDKSKYIKKREEIGRIQGKKFIEKIIEKYHLKHIRVPKKIAVIKEGLESVSFSVDDDLELISKNGQLTIYAEKIPTVVQMFSLEQAIEFMVFLEKTGYNDAGWQNFFRVQDDIYIVDTEFRNFSPDKPRWDMIKGLSKNFVDPKDAPAFLEEYEKRKAAYDKEEESRKTQVEEYWAAFKNPYTQLTKGYAKHHEFVFQLNSLFSFKEV